MTQAVGIPDKGWISESDLIASKALPFKRTVLRQKIAKGEFPAPKKFSERIVAYDCELVHEWIREQKTATPAQPFKVPAALQRGSATQQQAVAA